MKFEDVRVGDVFEDTKKRRFVVTHVDWWRVDVINERGSVFSYYAEHLERINRSWSDSYTLISRNARVVVMVEND